MELALTLAGGERGEVDVAVVAPPGTALGTVAVALADMAGAPHTARFAVGGAVLGPDAPLGVAPLVHGAVLRCGGTEPPSTGPGPRRVHVLGGPSAGTVHPLAAGTTVLGRGAEADLRLADPDVSRRHAVLEAGPDGVTIRDAGSANGTLTWDADPRVPGAGAWRPVAADGLRLPPGVPVRCGDSLLGWAGPDEPPASVQPDGAGALDLRRPPRIRPRRRAQTVTLPEPPPARQRVRFPWLMVAAPLVLGAVLWSVSGGNRAYLLLTVLSPALYAVNALGDRVAGGRDGRRGRRAHEAALTRVAEEVRVAVEAECTRRRRDAPDPAAVALTVAGPGARLWERRRDDADHLLVRVGTADLPAELTLRGPDPEPTPGPGPRPGPDRPGREAGPAHRAGPGPDRDANPGRWSRPAAGGPAARGRRWWRRVRRRAGVPDRTEARDRAGEIPDRHPTAPGVPVTLPLADLGVLGVAGPAPAATALTRWIVAQLAALHPPRDLRLVVLSASGDPGGRWRWTRWLPHAAPVAGHDAVAALAGTTADQVAARVRELGAVLDARLAADGSAPAEGTPRYVLVLDGADRLRAVPGVARLLSAGPAVGLSAVCLAADPLALPEECGGTVVLGPRGRARVATGGADPIEDVVPDLVSARWAETVGRGLAPLRDATQAEGGRLPAVVRLTDLAGAGATDAAALAEAWRRRARSTSTVLGVGTDGPVEVDLARHGPHALVAGTTGSGKSELLQSLVAGLALRNRPDEMSFLLVDHKGGAAFAECARLPHTVGVVTDLDAALTGRALRSLRAELRRREHVLAAVGVPDVDAHAAARDRTGGPPLPRLVIVVDEFASLVAELPDFVPGLVDIARRGRSLGVHLVLATQRPSGVVSPDIRANTALRLCLRVTDGAESDDVLDVPDAARIRPELPGRGIARLDGALVPLQVARVAGRPPTADGPRIAVVPRPWHRAGDLRPTAAPDRRTEAPTDLATLVDVVSVAASLVGAPPPPAPWAPPLPARLTLDDLPLPAPDRIPLGLHDLPAEQCRAAYVLDLAAGGHLALFGGPRSGRTSALRTLAGGLADRPDAHLYALDCGVAGWPASTACRGAARWCRGTTPDVARG